LDFYFKDKKLDLEIDGKHHFNSKRKKVDHIRDKNLEAFGIEVYRIRWKNPKKKRGFAILKREIEKLLVYLDSFSI
jgi:very-short-patch-repair endonuclease